MNISDNIWELIDKHRSANKADASDMEHEYNSEEFKEALEMQSKIDQILIINRLSTLKETLRKVHYFEKKKRFIKFLATIACFSVSVFIFGNLYFHNKTRVENKNLDSKDSAHRSTISKTIPKISNQVLENPTPSLKSLPGLEHPPKALIRPNEINTIKDSTISKYWHLDTPNLDYQLLTLKYRPSMLLKECDASTIKFNFNSQNSCIGKNSGKIWFENPIGGIKPYLYSIDGGETFNHQQSFINLPTNKYKLTIKDSSGCISNQLSNVFVSEIYCNSDTSNIDNELIFNPLKNTIFIPTKEGQEGKIEIFDILSGQLIYRINFMTFATVYWEGITFSGSLAKPGNYIYMVFYNNSETEKGSITIVY